MLSISYVHVSNSFTYQKHHFRVGESYFVDVIQTSLTLNLVTGLYVSVVACFSHAQTEMNDRTSPALRASHWATSYSGDHVNISCSDRDLP